MSEMACVQSLPSQTGRRVSSSRVFRRPWRPPTARWCESDPTSRGSAEKAHWRPPKPTHQVRSMERSEASQRKTRLLSLAEANTWARLGCQATQYRSAVWPVTYVSCSPEVALTSMTSHRFVPTTTVAPSGSQSSARTAGTVYEISTLTGSWACFPVCRSPPDTSQKRSVPSAPPEMRCQRPGGTWCQPWGTICTPRSPW